MRTKSQLKATILFWQFMCLLCLIMLLFYATKADASTIQLIPSSKNVFKGQNFNVEAVIVPDAMNYTVVLDMGFKNANFVSWTPSSDWLELKVKKYYETFEDSAVRTAGFPGGFSTTTTLGIFRLKATETGPVELTIGKDSMILDRWNKNVLK